jgi:hypothetical protein
MDDKLVVALVAGGAALLGSLIPTVAGYLNNKTQREFDVKKALLEKQRQVYSDLMLSLQRMINTSMTNTSTAEVISDLQRAVLHVSIYGDNSTAAALNDYYNALIASAQPGGSLLQKPQHQSHQRLILNGMRASMDLAPLASFEIVAIGSPSGTGHT